jgi:hypothetical protein
MKLRMIILFNCLKIMEEIYIYIPVQSLND